MTIDALIMLAGALVAVLPFLGFPSSWDTVLYFILGSFVIALGIVVRRRFFTRIHHHAQPPVPPKKPMAFAESLPSHAEIPAKPEQEPMKSPVLASVPALHHEPKVAHQKTESKPEVKAAPAPAHKPEAKVEQKHEPKQELKAPTNVPPSHEPKPEHKPEVKNEQKTEQKADVKSEPKTTPRPVPRPISPAEHHSSTSATPAPSPLSPQNPKRSRKNNLSVQGAPHVDSTK